MPEEIIKGVKQSEANQQQQFQLNMQMSQEKAKSAQDNIERDKRLQQIQSTALAMQGASGLTLTSGNFNNAQKQSYNTFAQDNQIADTDLITKEAEIQSAKDAANSNFHMQLFGDGMDLAKQAANIATMGAGSALGSKDDFLEL